MFSHLGMEVISELPWIFSIVSGVAYNDCIDFAMIQNTENLPMWYATTYLLVVVATYNWTDVQIINDNHGTTQLYSQL